MRFRRRRAAFARQSLDGSNRAEAADLAANLATLTDQLQATAPDGLVYLTINAEGRLVADWLSGGQQTVFSFDVTDIPEA